MAETSKTCAKCKCEKDLQFFHRHKRGRLGRASYCKECTKEYQKAWYAENKEAVCKKNREWHKKNKKEVSERHKKNRLKKLGQYKLTCKLWYENNKEAHRKMVRDWEKRNPEKLKKYNEKKRNDVNHMIRNSLRARVRSAVFSNNNYTKNNTEEIIGCSVPFLRKHLEKKFTAGMSWDNYGLFGWHIDHIKPCASFDLTDADQQKKCFHYTNLQPLWATENLKKGKKIMVTNNKKNLKREAQ